MATTFNRDYSEVDPRIMVDRDRERIADQIFAVLRWVLPAKQFQQARCVDVGSSNGVISKYFLRHVRTIRCIDTDKRAIALGRKANETPGLSFSSYTGRRLPFGNDSIDIVILRRVIEYTKYPKIVMQEIYRVLRPGGVVYFESHNRLALNLRPLTILPPGLKKALFTLIGRPYYYFGDFQTVWQLQTLLEMWVIHHLTPRILKDPHRFLFTKRYATAWIGDLLPLWTFQLIEPFLPVFIWVLEKPEESGQL